MPLIIGPTVRYGGRTRFTLAGMDAASVARLLEPDIRAALEVFPLPPINDETLPIMRPALAAPGPELSDRVVRSVIHAPSAAGAPDVARRLHRPKGARWRTAVSCVDARRRAGRDVPIWPVPTVRSPTRFAEYSGPHEDLDVRTHVGGRGRRTGGASSVFRRRRRTSRCADSPRAAEYWEYGRRGLIRRCWPVVRVR